MSDNDNSMDVVTVEAEQQQGTLQNKQGAAEQNTTSTPSTQFDIDEANYFGLYNFVAVFFF